MVYYMLMSCMICERVQLAGKNPYFVKNMGDSIMVLGDTQHFKGYCLLLYKRHIEDFLALSSKDWLTFTYELQKAAFIMDKAFHPERINIELLGNKDGHLHWHLFPRYTTDEDPTKPVWTIDWETLKKKATPKELAELFFKLQPYVL